MSGRRRMQGFTLLEVMVVVVIIGILAAWILPQLAGRTDQARVARAKMDIKTLSVAVDLFKVDNGFYPSIEDGLKALVEKPPSASNWPEAGYLKGLRTAPKDPWGRPYGYVAPGEGGLPYEIVCYGADGKPGGEGIDADISSATLSE